MQHFLAILLGFLRSIFRHATVFNTHFRRKASRSLIFLDFCHLSIACSGEILFEAIQETTPWFELWLGWYAKSEHVFLKLFLKNDDNDPCTSKFEFQSLSPACCLHDGSLLIVCEKFAVHTFCNYCRRTRQFVRKLWEIQWFWQFWHSVWSFEGLSRGHCGWKVEEAKAVMVDKQFSVDTFLLNALLLKYPPLYIPASLVHLHML